MLRKSIAVLALSAAVTGCASSGTKVDSSRVAAFERGKTTYTDVVSQLGAPNADLLADDGTRTVDYTYTQAKARPESFIPYVGLFVAGADAKTFGYQFKFDKNGVLASIETVNAQNSVNTGFLNAGH